ncbi:squalene/phytoene synthase family protein [Streptomyces corynorhini]|uniref:Phytoene/squalene synthetase n=1 Tax=Streptomyces corynorhini TaxID=2282652 RepID=A0A370B665_9ACTN|nr:squalene/phytoene synthase family protein [Streptomyces corynorhini]RDG37327.1 phytoene/squalene synthetase [Streptomyces corynorhini]
MNGWRRGLTEAGVRERGLRESYTRQATRLARYAPAQYAALRLLLPPATAVHVVAAVSFMHTCDELLDQDGRASVETRAARFARHEARVRAALASPGAPTGDLAPLWHTVRAHPRLAAHVDAFFRAAPADLYFTGFAGEPDFLAYVDEYVLPGLLLIGAVLAGPGESEERLRENVRLLAVPIQRIDFLTDLAEDLRSGRVCLPRSDLRAAGVGPGELRQGRATARVRTLLARTAAKCWADLAAARPAVAGVPALYAPMVAAQLDVYAHLLQQAQAHGARLLRGGVRPRIPAAAAILLRHRGAAAVAGSGA